jgi:hypothetical protein
MHKILKILYPAVVTLALMSSLPHVALSANAMQVPDSEAIAKEEEIKIATLNNDVMEVYDNFDSAADKLKLSPSYKEAIREHVEQAKADGVSRVYIEPKTVNGHQTYVVSYQKENGHIEHRIVNKKSNHAAGQAYIDNIRSEENSRVRMQQLNEKYAQEVRRQNQKLADIMAAYKTDMTSKQVGELYDRIRKLNALDKKRRDAAEEAIKREVSGNSGKWNGRRGAHKPSEKQKSEHTEQEKSVLSKINDRLFGKRPDAKKDLRQAQKQSDEERAIAEDE